MSSFESVFFWLAAVALAASFFLALFSLIFRRPAVFKSGVWLALLAWCLLTVFGITRWIGTDHPPFVTLFESMITSVWFMLLMFLMLRLWYRQLTILLMPLSFFGFLLIGWASSMETSASPLSTALENVWLFIHASFATSGAAAFVVAASFAVLYLMGEARLLTMEKIAAKIPEYNSLPKSILNFLIFGLILWGVMIVSGSIWANAAWGRYWAWDPIELWSLISWLMYGLVVHARIGFKISHRLFCQVTIAAALAIVFALWGVSYVYQTIHTYG